MYIMKMIEYFIYRKITLTQLMIKIHSKLV